MSEIPWHRLKIGPESSDVLEVADLEDGVLVRTYPGNLAILISWSAWTDFVVAMNSGEYDVNLFSGRRMFRTIGRRLKAILRVAQDDDGQIQNLYQSKRRSDRRGGFVEESPLDRPFVS